MIMRTEMHTSLVVTLPFRQCLLCTDVSSRWCKPRDDLGPGFGGGVNEGCSCSEESLKRKQWCWRICDLRMSAQGCNCCQFILQAIESSPWIVKEEDSYVNILSHLVGSTHSSPRAREQDDVQRRYLGNSRGTQYERYYRPRLQAFSKVNPGEPLLYVASDVVYLLPLMDYSVTAGVTQAFHGREVGAKADFDLIKQWFRSCTVDHLPTSDRRISNPSFLGAIVKGQDGCQPARMPLIEHFRLLDVEKRCIVLARPEDRYAALSYVWGASRRMLLRSDNLHELSAPGAFSSDQKTVPKTFLDAMTVAEQLRIRFIWIDAVCIIQDVDEQLVEHMNHMDKIYSSACVTIVSDTSNANTGIPGISMSRGPNQARFTRGGTTFISSKRPFGAALKDSYWESRAWCLQEKVFSKRLLIFTESQTFYHCTRSTWFEDTIIESHEYTGGTVHIAERSDPTRKAIRDPHYTAYEAHRPLFRRNFWSLTELYTRRQLSFETDIIRAYSGILKSLEPLYGPSLWGIPRTEFNQGLSWSISEQRMSLRRTGFPSWSWAGWTTNRDHAQLRFDLVLRRLGGIWHIKYYSWQGSADSEITPIIINDTEITAAQRRFRSRNFASDRNDSAVKTTQITQQNTSNTTRLVSSKFQSTSVDSQTARKSWSYASHSDPKSRVDTNSTLPVEPESQVRYEAHETELEKQQREAYTWMIQGHPGENDHVREERPTLVYNPATMPPLSHIISFYTSVATLTVDAHPGKDNSKGYGSGFHVRLPETGTVIASIPLVPDWVKTAREADFIYMSQSFLPPSDSEYEPEPALLNVVMLYGSGDVKSRVQSVGTWSIDVWRKTRPQWKMITLA